MKERTQTKQQARLQVTAARQEASQHLTQRWFFISLAEVPGGISQTCPTPHAAAESCL